MGHLERVKALAGETGKISHSLRIREMRGWIVIGRTPGGRAEYLDLTPQGLENASALRIQV